MGGGRARKRINPPLQHTHTHKHTPPLRCSTLAAVVFGLVQKVKILEAKVRTEAATPFAVSSQDGTDVFMAQLLPDVHTGTSALGCCGTCVCATARLVSAGVVQRAHVRVSNVSVCGSLIVTPSSIGPSHVSASL